MAKRVDKQQCAGLALKPGDTVSIVFESKTGWMEVKLRLPLPATNVPIDTVLVYELEPQDMAGLTPGYAVIFGKANQHD